MKRGIVVLLAVGLLVSIAPWSPLKAQFRGPRGEEQATKHGWIFSLEEGKAQARKSGKPLMVVIRCVP